MEGYAPLKAHPFFESITWEDLRHQTPPKLTAYLPAMSEDDEDCYGNVSQLLVRVTCKDEPCSAHWARRAVCARGAGAHRPWGSHSQSEWLKGEPTLGLFGGQTLCSPEFESLGLGGRWPAGRL